MGNEGAKQGVVRLIIEKLLAADVVEERVVQYICREVRVGRKLVSVLQDPYIQNRVNPELLCKVLQNPAIVKAVEEELIKAFREKCFKMAD